MSWEQLDDWQREVRELAVEASTTPPSACPNDGTPLQPTSRGPDELHCPYDGYRWPRDRDVG